MNFVKLNQMEKRVAELERLLSSQEIVSDKVQYSNLLKEYGNLNTIVTKYRKYKEIKKEIDELDNLLRNTDDNDLKDLTFEEKNRLLQEIQILEEEIDDMTSDKTLSSDEIIMEIRSAAGGEESSLFAYDLFRMYTRYAERKGYKVEIFDFHQTGLKGFKEIVFGIKGKKVYETFKYESGIHRVQRVPVTEASGRIHTSTVTVAVLPQIKEIEFKIKQEEIKIETFRASGHGGQHLQKTESAVKITHLPTGISAQCQDERSQIKNKEKALKVLTARVYNKFLEEQKNAVSSKRKEQIGTGERAEKIRTYNYLQNRVTDHRINFSLYNLEKVMEGELDEIIEQLKKHENQKESVL